MKAHNFGRAERGFWISYFVVLAWFLGGALCAVADLVR